MAVHALNAKFWDLSLAKKIHIFASNANCSPKPKTFFLLKSVNLCTCWKSIAPFFVLFCQLLAFYRLPIIRKSKYHLVNNQVRRGVGQKLPCMHVYKDLIGCKSICDVISRIDPLWAAITARNAAMPKGIE